MLFFILLIFSKNNEIRDFLCNRTNENINSNDFNLHIKNRYSIQLDSSTLQKTKKDIERKVKKESESEYHKNKQCLLLIKQNIDNKCMCNDTKYRNNTNNKQKNDIKYKDITKANGKNDFYSTWTRRNRLPTNQTSSKKYFQRLQKNEKLCTINNQENFTIDTSKGSDKKNSLFNIGIIKKLYKNIVNLLKNVLSFDKNDFEKRGLLVENRDNVSEIQDLTNQNVIENQQKSDEKNIQAQNNNQENPIQIGINSMETNAKEIREGTHPDKTQIQTENKQNSATQTSNQTQKNQQDTTLQTNSMETNAKEIREGTHPDKTQRQTSSEQQQQSKTDNSSKKNDDGANKQNEQTKEQKYTQNMSSNEKLPKDKEKNDVLQHDKADKADKNSDEKQKELDKVANKLKYIANNENKDNQEELQNSIKSISNEMDEITGIEDKVNKNNELEKSINKIVNEFDKVSQANENKTDKNQKSGNDMKTNAQNLELGKKEEGFSKSLDIIEKEKEEAQSGINKNNNEDKKTKEEANSKTEKSTTDKNKENEKLGMEDKEQQKKDSVKDAEKKEDNNKDSVKDADNKDTDKKDADKKDDDKKDADKKEDENKDADKKDDDKNDADKKDVDKNDAENKDDDKKDGDKKDGNKDDDKKDNEKDADKKEGENKDDENKSTQSENEEKSKKPENKNPQPEDKNKNQKNEQQNNNVQQLVSNNMPDYDKKESTDNGSENNDNNLTTNFLLKPIKDSNLIEALNISVEQQNDNKNKIISQLVESDKKLEKEIVDILSSDQENKKSLTQKESDEMKIADINEFIATVQDKAKNKVKEESKGYINTENTTNNKSESKKTEDTKLPDQKKTNDVEQKQSKIQAKSIGKVNLDEIEQKLENEEKYDNDFTSVQGGMHILNTITKNLDFLKNKNEDKSKKITGVLIYKDNDNYTDYWGKLKFKKEDDKYIDETGYFEGELCDSFEEITEKGVLTPNGFFQNKNIPTNDLMNQFGIIKRLIKDISHEQKKPISELFQENNDISILDKLIFANSYTNMLKNGESGKELVKICICDNDECKDPCKNVRWIDKKYI